jgi:hypothetical protein
MHKPGRRRGRVRRRATIIVIALWLGALGLVCSISGCRSKVDKPDEVPVIGPALLPAGPSAARPPSVRFKDITAAAGIQFHHVNGAFGKKMLPETMGAGVAFLDYDNDGKPDLLLVNSCYWPGHEDRTQPPPTLALYHNKGDGTFEDVTATSGLAVTMYGMGVTAGDYDNDGFTDVFVTGVGGNRLFHNVADGKGGRRFVDVTQAAGVGGPGGWPTGAGDFLKVQAPINFSTSAAFLDYDGDGRLDLFVCNYVTWSPDLDLQQGFQLVGLGRAYGPPTAFGGAQCFLYKNQGDGRFADVSAAAGIQVTGSLGRSIGKSLGVVVCDVDDDGWPDILVANDTVRNFFFHNKGDGTFEELGERTGIAYAEGSARGAMGADWGEFRPGRSAFAIGNFANEPDTFLRLDNPRQLLFSDAALAEGIAGPSRMLLKFGVAFLDYDLDARQDLLTCNGHLEPEISQVQAGQTYKQPAQLFWNTGGKRTFEPVTAEQAGRDLFRPMVGRGLACADIDGNGTPDVVLTENGGPARLLRNEGGTGHSWVRLTLVGDGARSNRSALGARVTVEAGGVTQRREVMSARGYLSQSELPLTFGLGDARKVERVTIQWPGKAGGKQVLTDLTVNQAHIVRQADLK